jgi:uncharacterized RDD family membrane protein YckC
VTAYSTFWRRFWAGFIDGCVVGLPIGILEIIFRLGTRGDGAHIAWNAGTAAAGIIYSVLMHANGGQTVGKKACGVIVLDKGERRTPTLKEAMLRDMGSIVPTAVVVGFVLMAVVSGDYQLEPDRIVAVTDVLAKFNGFWLLTELATMLTNDRRRALHDYIGGTVVMGLESVPVGVLDARV